MTRSVSFVLCTLLLLLSALPGCQQSSRNLREVLNDIPKTATDAPSKTHIDKKYGFSFQYPENWSKMELEGIHLGLFADEVNGFSPNFNIVVVAADPHLMRIKKSDLIKQYEGNYQNVEIENFEKIKFDGRQGITVRFLASTGEGIRLKIVQYIFNEKGNCYILTFGDRQDHFEKSAGDFDMIVGTFKFPKK